jgi:NAD-dependent deacetylase
VSAPARATGAESVVVLTGAGISADSGVRTFRDAGGLWEGVRPEDLATPETWARDRATVWRFYQRRRSQLATVAPNAAHEALAAFELRLAEAGVAFTLITQNVDDLHERAGSRPVHMHGEISVLRCECCGSSRRDLESLDPDRYVACGACPHDAMRPDVVWFGEVPYHLDRIDDAVAGCTHFVAVGTSGVVWPAAGLLHAARGRGATTWVQSLEAPANLGMRDRFWPGRAVDAVPGLLMAVELEIGLPAVREAARPSDDAPR